MGQCPPEPHKLWTPVRHPDPQLWKMLLGVELGDHNQTYFYDPRFDFFDTRSGTQTGKAVTLRAWRFCGFNSHLDHLIYLND